MLRKSEHMSREIIDVVAADIEAQREPLIELCADLVAAESVNPPGNTTQVARVVRGYLAKAGIDISSFAVDSTTPNVIGSVAGRSAGRHVVFNAHSAT